LSVGREQLDTRGDRSDQILEPSAEQLALHESNMNISKPCEGRKPFVSMKPIVYCFYSADINLLTLWPWSWKFTV